MLRKFLKQFSLCRQLHSLARKRMRFAFKPDSTQMGTLNAIRELLTESSPPYLVDVGAHDGTTFSNSAFFIKKGWNAILIEPLPGPFQKLSKKYRKNSNVECLNVACSNQKGYGDFFIGSDGPDSLLSTLCQDKNKWFEDHRSDKTIKVRVETTTNILIRSQYPKDFSLLLVDTEGMDYEVLLGLDFGSFNPRIIVTEEYKLNMEKHLRKNKGYKVHRIVGCNSIWVQKRFEKVPAKVTI